MRFEVYQDCGGGKQKAPGKFYVNKSGDLFRDENSSGVYMSGIRHISRCDDRYSHSVSIERYDLVTQNDNGDECEGYMEKCDDGEYVRFSDL